MSKRVPILTREADQRYRTHIEELVGTIFPRQTIPQTDEEVYHKELDIEDDNLVTETRALSRP